jgi:spore germination cell wall hydrolase CwlJ-like protein
LRAVLAAILLVSVANVKASVSDEACFAYVSYREASNQSLEGIKAVTEVVEHRMLAERKSCREVVSRHGQFTWHHRKIVMNPPRKWLTRYSSTRKMSKILPECSLWFYSGRKPKWAKSKRVVKVVGKHKFLC